MAIGLSEKFSILHRSPHDLATEPVASPGPEAEHWVPSRYNIRAKSEDGRLVLWNTLSGSMSVFEPEKTSLITKALKKKGFEAKKTGIVEYLVERGFLVKKGVNEYRQFQMQFGKQHYRRNVLQLTLMPSEDCNFRCDYCYEEFARGTMPADIRGGIKKWVTEQKDDLKHLQIGWFGGEPLYGWEAIEDLAPYMSDLARDNDLAYFSHMTTNGYLLTPEIADKLLEWRVTNYQITLDGHPDDHNRTRPTRTGEGTFDQIFSNLKAMASRDAFFHITLRVNFDQNNHRRFPEFLDMLEREFANDERFKLHFHAVGRWGGSNDENLEVCGAEEQGKVMGEMLEEAKRRDLGIGTLRDLARPGGQVCYAARPYHLLIGSSGKIMKCTIALDMDDKNVVGRVTPEGEFIIDDDKLALWTEPAFESDSQCQKCVVLPNCQGIHCPLIRMNEDRQPCISTRSNPKRELLGVLQQEQDRARVVTVNGG